MTSRPVEEVTRCHDGQEDTQSFAPLPLDVSLEELVPPRSTSTAAWRQGSTSRS